MSETSARARRFALTFGSLERKGFIREGAGDDEAAEGAGGAEGVGTARGVGALDDAGVGCGRGGTGACAGPRPGTFGAEGRGVGGGVGPDGRCAGVAGAPWAGGGVMAREPPNGVLRAKGATPG